MTALTPIPLPSQSYQARSLTASAQRLVNMYAERNPEGAKSPVSLYRTPGLTPWVEVGSGPCRGIQVMGPHVYVVSGAELYRISSSGTSQLIGTVNGTFHCRMTDNGTHVGIATENEIYAANESEILTHAQTGMCGAAFLDGYGVFPQRGTEDFYITGLDDMTTIDALDFSAADAVQDLLVGCIVDHRELWLAGERTTEIWGNVGNAAFPFARNPGGFIERGCASPGSLAKSERHVFLLGDDLSVYASQGYQLNRVSTPAIEALILDQSDHASAEGFAYTQAGHTFYVLSFANLTITYDATLDKWHERESYGASRWRASRYAQFGARHIVGDYETGALYELDLEAHDEDGVAPEAVIAFPTLHANGQRMILDELLLDFETGVGLDGDVDGASDPQVSLDWSDDGGKTWCTPIMGSLGELGSYGTRVRFHRLGMFYQRVLRVRARASVKIALIGAYGRFGVMQ